MISVVTAYYNRKKLFTRTLESMNAYYSKINFEVIVVDDGSDEKERLEDLLITYPFLRIIRLEKENKWYKNPCIPFNIGFEAIQGDKVIIQNPECYHFDSILEHVDKNLNKNEYLSFGCYSLDELNTNQDDLFFDRIHIQNLIIENNRSFMTDGDLGWYNHSLHRREAFHFCSAIMAEDLFDIGGFDERYAKGVGFDDDDLIWRIKAKKMNIKFIDNKIVLHQNHYTKPQNVIEAEKKRRESYKRNQRIFEDITQCNNPWKANYLESTYISSKIENNTASNYFLEYNKVTKELVKYKFSRKIGIILLRFLSKLKF